MYKTLNYSCHNGVGELGLNRAARLNTINPEMATEIEALMATLRDDTALRALIIHGDERAFCAGADIEALNGLDGADNHYRFIALIQSALNAVEALPVPTIAAINGIAFGGGCELAIACDFRIMAEDAKIGVPEVKLGLLPGAGGSQRLARLLPLAVAKQMVYFGDPLSAADALHHGLINAVVPASEVGATAREWAERLCRLAPLAIRSGKALMHSAALAGLANGIDAERQALAFLFQTQDASEGIRAFLEKRAPDFQGS